MFNKIYFIHNPLSKDREQFINNIISIFPDKEIKYIWKVAGKDLNEEELSYFKNGATSFNHFKNACSLVINHMHCLEDFLSSEEEHTIIFEDDCYCDNKEELNKVLGYIKELGSFDSVYLGDGCFPNKDKDKSHGLILRNESRCSECIVYSRNGARKILDYYNNSRNNKEVFCLLDFYLTDCYQNIKDYKNYHSNPTPIHQGTIYGKIRSSINC